MSTNPSFCRNQSGLIVFSVLLGIFLLTLPALATKTFKPVFNPSITVVKASGDIKIDGHLNDPGWKNAGMVNNFVERNPGDKTEPAVNTEALLAYDENNLYVAFCCYDNPKDIRATMCQRDQFGSDDAAILLIDTYGNASWAYEFFVNPYGVQKDRLWSSIGGEDAGFDLIWESAATITDSGFQVEIAVPFTSMRFPNKDIQNWKIDLWRNRPRESFNQYSWAAYDRNEQCWPCQWGTIDGIENVKPGKGIELLPTYVSNQAGYLNDISVPASKFENHDPNGEFSMGGKYAVTSNITLEAAYNPDFSQVEEDEAQFSANSTVELMNLDKRPFFQEGSDIFRTLFNSMYTRSIEDPEFAAKLTGRIGRTTFGFLSVRDEATRYTIPLEERDFVFNTGKSTVNVLRGLHSFDNASHLGFIFTDRRLDGGGSGTIFALDGNIRLTKNYRLDGQFIGSHIKEPDDHTGDHFFGTNESPATLLNYYTFNKDRHTALFDGESFYGHALITRFQREARRLNFSIGYDEASPSYRTETGYDPYNNYRHISMYAGYNFYLENNIIEKIEPQISTHKGWNFEKINKEGNINVGLSVQTNLAQTSFDFYYNIESEKFNDVWFDDLWSVYFGFGSRLNNQVGMSASINRGVGIRYISNPKKQNTTGLYASLNLKPIDRIIIEPNISFYSGADRQTGESYYKGVITRTRIRYQVNRQLSLRLFVQYNDFNLHWDIDPLLTYRISPFSVFYIGTTVDYDELPITADYQSTKWRLSSRQFFMKLQYLFRI
jgi:hypothetical protein